jgi:hypothetical protein
LRIHRLLLKLRYRYYDGLLALVLVMLVMLMTVSLPSLLMLLLHTWVPVEVYRGESLETNLGERTKEES